MTPRQQSILVGAVVTGVLSTSYLGFINFFCCIGVILGGLVTVQQLTSRTGSSIASGDGAVLGALAGVGGAVVGAVLDRALRPFGLDARSIQQDMMSNMAQNMEGQQGLPPMLEQFQGGGGDVGVVMLLFGIVFNAILYAIFGAIGGAIGTALFGEDDGGGQDVQTAQAEIVE